MKSTDRATAEEVKAFIKKKITRSFGTLKLVVSGNVTCFATQVL